MADEALRRREREAIASGDTLVMTALGIDLARVGKAREAGALALRVASGLGDAAPVLDALVPDLDAFVVKKVSDLTDHLPSYPERRLGVERLTWSVDGHSIFCVARAQEVLRLFQNFVDAGETKTLASLPASAAMGPLVPTVNGDLWAWVRVGDSLWQLVPASRDGFGEPIWSDDASFQGPRCAFHSGGAAELCGVVFDRGRLRSYALRGGRRSGRGAAWKLDLVHVEVDPVGATGSGLSYARGGARRLHLFTRFAGPPLATIVLGSAREYQDVTPWLGQVTAGRTVVETPDELRLLARDGALLGSIDGVRRISHGSWPFLRLGPSGWQGAVCDLDGVTLVDLRQRRSRRLVDLGSAVFSAAWSPSGRELAVSTNAGIFRVAPLA